MKIRDGFVSNSSSSSFLIEFKALGALVGLGGLSLENDPSTESTELGKKYIEKKKLLWENGFRPTIAHTPMYLYMHGNHGEDSKDAWIWKPTKKHYMHGMVRYGLCVTCNEDEVITFLLKEKIPFRAVTHYGHWHMIYNGGKVFWQVANLGEQIGTYGRSNPDAEYREIKKYHSKGCKEGKQFHRINVQEYLHPKPLTDRQKAIQQKRMERWKAFAKKVKENQKTKEYVPKRHKVHKNKKERKSIT